MFPFNLQFQTIIPLSPTFHRLISILSLLWWFFYNRRGGGGETRSISFIFIDISWSVNRVLEIVTTGNVKNGFSRCLSTKSTAMPTKRCKKPFQKRDIVGNLTMSTVRTITYDIYTLENSFSTN